jgi:hypothetical protein
MQDFKVLPTVNGVGVSLEGHPHAVFTNAGTASTDAIMENVNDTYGTVRMHFQNRTGVNGMMFEQLGSVDLVDFVFKSLTKQSNIRLESRPTYLYDQVNNTVEWQIGTPGGANLIVGDGMTIIQSPLTILDYFSSTNINVDGYSTSAAPVKVYTAVTQAIASVTNTKLIFGTVDYNTTIGAWNAGLNRYVAISPGIHSVKGSVRTTGTVRSSRLMLYKNGVFYCSLQDNNTTASTSPSYNGSVDINLLAGDYLELWFYASGTSTIAAGLDCNFSVIRIN